MTKATISLKNYDFILLFYMIDFCRVHFNRYSVNDYFSWKTYESFPKTSYGTDMLYIGHNSLTSRRNSAWHLKLKCKNTINNIKNSLISPHTEL
jgi:hypothetical protein